MKYGNIYRAILERPWAILPSTLDLMVEVLELRMDGIRFDAEEIQKRIEASNRGPRDGNQAQKPPTIGVVPIYGVISPRMDLMSESSGGTNVENISKSLRAALNDPEIGAILLDIDSPGGNVEGIEELANEIRAARDIKPITAMARYTMASAAYYLGSQANEVVVTPTGQVGSIGIVYAHQDLSEAMAKEGVKTTLITHGKNKAEGNKFEPLSDEARAEIQEHVNYYGAMFEKAVSAGRGVPVETVRDNFGAGRMFTAKQAVKVGLADKVEVFGDTMARLGRAASLSATTHAMAAQSATVGIATPVNTGVSNWITQPYTGAIEGLAVSPLPFAERLVRVADEVEAVVGHARERAVLRAEEGRELSSETREQLARVLALRPVLEDIEALLAEPAKPRIVGPRLDLLIEAYEKGYPVTDLMEGLSE